MRRLPVFALIVFFVVGCGTSEPVKRSYSSLSDETKYTTQRMRLSDMNLQSGLSSPARFYLQVQGHCEGKGCTPSQYALRFIKEGQTEVRLTSRQVELTVGDKTMTWEERHNMTELTSGSTLQDPVRIRSGTVVTVYVSGGQLSTLGSVSSVRGKLGNASFDLSHDARAPIRALVGELEKTATSSGGSSGQ